MIISKHFVTFCLHLQNTLKCSVCHAYRSGTNGCVPEDLSEDEEYALGVSLLGTIRIELLEVLADSCTSKGASGFDPEY